MYQDATCAVIGCGASPVRGSRYCERHYPYRVSPDERKEWRDFTRTIIGEIKLSDAERRPIKHGREIIGWHNGVIKPDVLNKIYEAAGEIYLQSGKRMSPNEARSLAFSAFWRSWKRLAGQELPHEIMLALG